MGTPAPGWSPMILGSLSLRTVAGSAVPRGSGGGYSCSWVPLALLHRYAAVISVWLTAHLLSIGNVAISHSWERSKHKIEQIWSEFKTTLCINQPRQMAHVQTYYPHRSLSCYHYVVYFCSKIKILNVNCARATAFIFDSRRMFLGKCW